MPGHPGSVCKAASRGGECLRVTVGAPVAFANSGDDIVLVDPQGRTVQRVTYTAVQAQPGISIPF